MTQVVVDVGGSWTRVAVVEKGRLAKRLRYGTSEEFERGIKLLASKIRQLGGKAGGQVILGMAGALDRKRGKIFKSPSLPGWSGKSVVGRLSEQLSMEVKLENDAALAALGEAKFGAGRGYRIVGFLTLSTGIGGARVVGGKIDARAWGFEPGHHFMAGSGRELLTFEQLASGRGFERQFGIKPEKCEDKSIWQKYTRWLGRGVVNTLLYWSPEVLVLGGGVTGSWDKFYEPMVKFVRQHLVGFPAPVIVKGKLGDEAGLYGGMGLVS